MASPVPASAPPYVCLGPEETARFSILVTSFVDEQLATAPASADALEGFVALFDRTWLAISPIIGAKGVRAIMARATKLTQARRPLLDLVDVSEEGVSLARLRAGEPPAVEVLRASMTDLFCTAMDVLCSLIGIDLVQPMLQSLERSPEGRG